MKININKTYQFRLISVFIIVSILLTFLPVNITKVSAAPQTKTLSLEKSSQYDIGFTGKPDSVTLRFKPHGGQTKSEYMTVFTNTVANNLDSYRGYENGARSNEYWTPLPSTHPTKPYPIMYSRLKATGYMRTTTGYQVSDSTDSKTIYPGDYAWASINYNPYRYSDLYATSGTSDLTLWHGDGRSYYGHHSSPSSYDSSIVWAHKELPTIKNQGMLSTSSASVEGTVWYTASKMDLDYLRIYVNGSKVKEVFGTVSKDAAYSIAETIPVNYFTGTNDKISFDTNNTHTQIQVELVGSFNDTPTLDMVTPDNQILSESSLFKLKFKILDGDAEPVNYTVKLPEGARLKDGTVTQTINGTCSNGNCTTEIPDAIYFSKDKFPSGTSITLTVEATDGKASATPKTITVRFEDSDL